MNIQEIIAELSITVMGYPRDAIAEAIEQRAAITPELIRIIENAKHLDWKLTDNRNNFGHIYAMYLLAQFREHRAYPVFIDFITGDQEMVKDALDDTIADGLGRMLASVYDGNIQPIYSVIENEELDQFVRGAAIVSLIVLVTEGAISRDDVMVYFKSLFNGKLAREHHDVWSILVDSCNVLYPEEVVDDIKKAYEDGLVDHFYTQWEETEYRLQIGKDQTLAVMADVTQYKFIEDINAEFAYWEDFLEHQKEISALQALPQIPKQEQLSKQVQWKAEPKTGRNEPCPCGSGKKYKKCCGA